MGMFDTFKNPAPCHQCGTILDDWQTKDLVRKMDTWNEGDDFKILDFQVDRTRTYHIQVYDTCKSCGAWNDAVIKIKDGKVADIEVLGAEPKNETSEHVERLAGFMHQLWIEGFLHQRHNSNTPNLVRWTMQANTQYNNLSEEDKEKNRNIARQIMAVLRRGRADV